MPFTVADLKEMEAKGTLLGMFTSEQIPDEVYHNPECPGISRSGLNMIAESPAKYKYHYIDGNPIEETDALSFGKGFHKAILQYEEFEKNFASDEFAYKLGSRNSNDYKDAVANYKRLCPNVELLKEKEFNSMKLMVKAIKEHPIASIIFKGGIAEAVLFWIDPATGILCRCMIDLIRDDLVLPGHFFAGKHRTKKFIVDLKSTTKLMEFEKQIGKYRLFCQDPWYQWGMKNVFRDEYAFLFVAVDKKPIHDIRIGVIDNQASTFGSILINYALATYAECKRKNEWPRLNLGIETFKLPEYFYNSFENDKKETEVPNE